MNNHPIILASGSKTRYIQLCRLNINFTAIAPDIDESPLPNESITAMVERLALAKAMHIAKQYPSHIIIAGDQVQEVNGKIQGKPNNIDTAIKQLQNSSGKTTYFRSGLCVVNSQNMQTCSKVISTKVVFKQLDMRTIEVYLAKDKPLECAGSIRAEGMGFMLMQSMESQDPSAVLGLPLMTLVGMLETLNYDMISQISTSKEST